MPNEIDNSALQKRTNTTGPTQRPRGKKTVPSCEIVDVPTASDGWVVGDLKNDRIFQSLRVNAALWIAQILIGTTCILILMVPFADLVGKPLSPSVVDFIKSSLTYLSVLDLAAGTYFFAEKYKTKDRD